MLDKLKGAWEWIVAAGAAVGALLAYGWFRERQGRQRAAAKAKVEKAKRERKRADAKIEDAEEKIRTGTKREKRAARAAEKLRIRSRRRLEEAAVETGRSAAEAQNMTDEQIMEAVGG